MKRGFFEEGLSASRTYFARSIVPMAPEVVMLSVLVTLHLYWLANGRQRDIETAD